MNDDENTHLAEEETIADIFDKRVVAFDACIYNADGSSADVNLFFSSKSKAVSTTQICYPKHLAQKRGEPKNIIKVNHTHFQK